MSSKFWVLETYFETVYILDDGYNVWDFDIGSVNVLSLFIDIIGISQDGISPAVIKYSKTMWSNYSKLDMGGENKLKVSMLLYWKAHDYLCGTDLCIYTPNILISRGLRCLISESGDLLRADIESGTTLDLESISKRVLGFLYGYDFDVVITENVEIANYYFLWETHRVNIIMDFHGHDKEYDNVSSRLNFIIQMLPTVHMVRRKS